MGINLDSKCKQCRRAGEKLFLKGERCYTAKCAMVKRNYPPGVHGNKNRRRLSDYGLQLAEKQKAKKFYGLLEKQFHLTFEKASRKAGDTGKNFLSTLEMRLDNVIYRTGWASSRSAARQLVNHGHFTVNGRKTDIPSFSVKPGQVIALRPKSQKSFYFKNRAEKMLKIDRPGWLNFTADDASVKILHEPQETDLPQNINTQVIIEYYSK